MSLCQHQELPPSAGKGVDWRVLQSSQAWPWRNCHLSTSLSLLSNHDERQEDTKTQEGSLRTPCCISPPCHINMVLPGMWCVAMSQQWSCQWLFPKVAHTSPYLTVHFPPLHCIEWYSLLYPLLHCSFSLLSNCSFTQCAHAHTIITIKKLSSEQEGSQATFWHYNRQVLHFS